MDYCDYVEDKDRLVWCSRDGCYVSALTCYRCKDYKPKQQKKKIKEKVKGFDKW